MWQGARASDWLRGGVKKGGGEGDHLDWIVDIPQEECVSKGQRGKRGGSHSDPYVCVSVCVYFSWTHSVFQFTIVASRPLLQSISYPVGLWNVRYFKQHSRGNYCRCENLSSAVCHCFILECSISLYVRLFENQAILHWPCSTQLRSFVTVCAGGRSAGCGHAVPGWAPGPEAPSSGQWEG